jgi:hypothetical protein
MHQNQIKIEFLDTRLNSHEVNVFRLMLLLLLWSSLILSACGGPTPEADVVLDEASSKTSSEASPETSSEEIFTPTPTLTIIPSPVSPIPTLEDSPVTYNPDLNYAQVIFVRATQGNDGLWKFDTTVRHNDEGWDHYADAWQVVDSEGNVLTERVLTHPHDTEQPVTRGQSNIDIPSGLTQVIVRAKCNVHGFGGQEVVVDLTAPEGENFEVIR